jgi:hypothetical protein
MMVLLILSFLLVIYLGFAYQKEHFIYLDKDVVVKNDKFMDFLSDIKDNDVQYAFSKQPPQSPQEDIDRSILNTSDPELSHQDDLCRHKAASLCTRTDPRMYLTAGNIRFPPRWTGPYKDATLPMNIDVNCYNHIYNCCKN